MLDQTSVNVWKDGLVLIAMKVVLPYIRISLDFVHAYCNRQDLQLATPVISVKIGENFAKSFGFEPRSVARLRPLIQCSIH